MYRAKAFAYDDARGKVTRIADSVGFRDTVGTRYSGLGYVDSTSFVTRRDTATAATVWRTTEGFFTDGLANQVQSFRMSNVANRRLGSTSTTAALRAFAYDTTRLGRLVADTAGDGVTHYEYDPAGNTSFTYRVPPAGVPNTTLEDRASYYGADGRLRAADYRQLVNATNLADRTLMAFEEYRYDALGRRVLVRARRQCDFTTDRPKRQCSLDLVRRTVWDGTQELAEIQMPDGPLNGQVDQAERDTGFVAIPPFTLAQDPQYFDPNPYFGRVLYTHGLALDHPVSITRVEYTDNPQVTSGGGGGQGASRWDPLSVVPVWNDRGQADLFYFADTGSAPYCRMVGISQRCVRGSFPFAWFAYDRAATVPREWHGTLPEDKADEAGTLYRRARYYEPTTGRFTQEDPIGLAGGLNLYGFAAGDPVNFTDPFGLDPYVNCRPVGGTGNGGAAAHCAVRVVDSERNIDVTVELLQVNDLNEIYWRSAPGDRDRQGYSVSGWIRVATPTGMTPRDFDTAVLNSALAQTMARRGRDYDHRGSTNSNRFIFDVITGAGGKVPSVAAKNFTFAPGLCGGRGYLRGDQCSR